MAEPFESPVDITASEQGLPGLAQMVVAVGIASFVLAMLNSHALAAWADGLQPGARSERIVAMAHGLAGKTAAGGLDAPRADLHTAWLKVKSARWPSQAADQGSPQ